MEYHEIEEFGKLAAERFGDKVEFMTIVPPQENIDKINQDRNCHLTIETFKNYGNHVWLKEIKCPNCGADLNLHFDWGIPHGEGFCSLCRETTFKVYHFLGEEQTKIIGWELIGF